MPLTRRTRRLIFELGLVALLSGGSLITAQDKPEPTFAEMVKMPVVYSVPGMERVVVRHALVYRTVDAFLREGLQGGAPLELLNHPSGRHGFDILDDHARSREIVARTFDFLETHLR